MRLADVRVVPLIFVLTCSTAAVDPDTVPPAVPETGASPSVELDTYAIDSIQFGEALNGVTNEAWRSFGYDLDGKRTTRASTDVCSLQGPTSNQVDGFGGRDNAFGMLITPLLELFINPSSFGVCIPVCDAGPSQPWIMLSDQATDSIAQGAFTLQLSVTGLSGVHQTATGLSMSVFTSDAFDPDGGTSPSFDTTTIWPVQAESVNNGTSIASGAKAIFSNAYVVDDVFVAGTNEIVDVPLHLRLLGAPVTLILHAAIVTFTHTGVEASSGVLAGVLETNALVDAFHRIAGALSQSLCGSAFDAIAEQLKEAADILVDRTNQPGTPCTGISVGLAFHALQIATPTTVVADAPFVDPCAALLDAGMDGDASDGANE